LTIISCKKLLNEKTVFIDVRRVEEWAETGAIESSQLLIFCGGNGNFDEQK